MFCSYCGEKLAEKARFCMKCGKQVPALPVTEKVTQAETESGPVEYANGAFEICPRCGHQHRLSVYRCANCDLQARMEEDTGEGASSIRFNWHRGFVNGLGAYVLFQFALALWRPMNFETEWPFYLFFAGFWTTVFALGLPTGYGYGAAIGLVILRALINPSPVSALESIATVGMMVAAVSVILAAVGLWRGRLEFLGLHSRTAISRLFMVTLVALLAVSFLPRSNSVVSNLSLADQNGTIEFGDTVNMSTGMLSQKMNKFKVGDKFAWKATLRSEPGTTQVLISLSQVQSEGAELSLGSQPLTISDPRFRLLWKQGSLAFLEPGRYRMRIVVGGQVLAMGTFELGK